jgi:hypothetical protein
MGKGDDMEKEEEETAEPETELEQALKQKVALAAKVARAAGGMEIKAFEKVLDYLLALDRVNSGEVGREQRIPTARRVPKASTADLERIKPILDAPAATIAGEVAVLSNLSQAYKIYGVLRFAHDKFGIDGLTLPEFRQIVNSRMRLGIPDGTLRGNLSKSPVSEIGREMLGDDQLYRLMNPGEKALNEAILKANDTVKKPEDTTEKKA